MEVRERCYKGYLASHHYVSLSQMQIVFQQTTIYKDTQFWNLSADKFNNMKNQFQPLERHPDYIHSSVVINSARNRRSSSASHNTTEPPPTKKPQKQSSCSNSGMWSGCDGSGHTNPKHWRVIWDRHQSPGMSQDITCIYTYVFCVVFIVSTASSPSKGGGALPCSTPFTDGEGPWLLLRQDQLVVR